MSGKVKGQKKINDDLSRDSRNLTELVKRDKTLLPMFRDKEIRDGVAAIRQRKSVLLVGPARSGKTSTILGIAAALKDAKMQCLELSASSILVGTRYLGEWPTKLMGYVDSAARRNAVLYFVDVVNLARIGQSSNDKHSSLDILRPLMQSGDVVLVGEVTQEGYKRMLRVPGFAELFHRILLEPLSSQQVDQIVTERAGSYIDHPFDENFHPHLKELTENYTPPDPGPGTRLNLIQRIQSYAQEKAAINRVEPIDTVFIDKVFSMYTGLPAFVFSRNMTVSASEIRRWFQQRIFGQAQAIEAVVESITLFKSGLRDPNQPIGTFLFTGPTGVGKTELSKALAEYLYGSSQRLLRFDMSEFATYNSYQQLIGQGGDNSSALLIDPVRAQPFQVILFDEIEKGHTNIFDLLLQLLDEGRMTQPDGQTIDFRNTIVICTTNAGANEMSRPTPGFRQEESPSVPLHVLENYFRPEFLNRFQHVLVFHALDKSQVRLIAQGEVKKIIRRSGIVSRNLIVDIDESVVDVIVQYGYSDRYGARALKREVQRRLALPIGAFLMENRVQSGALVSLSCVDGRTIVKSFSDSDSGNPEPVNANKNSTVSAVRTAELRNAFKMRAERIESLERAVNVKALRVELATIDQSRETGDFWQNRDNAMQMLKRAESINEELNRLERLGNRVEDLARTVEHSPSREQLTFADTAGHALDKDIECCELELLVFGDAYKNEALVALQTVGDSCVGRDELYELYSAWCREMNREFTLLCEPLQDDDPAVFMVAGSYACGYLNGEAGIHRHRVGSVHAATKVSVAPYTVAETSDFKPEPGQQLALKKTGQYGGKVRSMVEINQSGIKLQNNQSIVENRELAADIVASWQQVSTFGEVVRRYDSAPFFVKDYATGTGSGRRSILRGEEFTGLLAQRARLLIQQERELIE